MARRGALAGAVAAATWQGCDPVLKHIFGTPYVDAELIGPFITRGPLQPLVNFATHTAAGAVFGHLFEELGGHGIRRGVTVALVENTLLWPGMAVIDLIHPSVRDGTWPPLVGNARAFASATTGHAFFGALLGLLVRDV